MPARDYSPRQILIRLLRLARPYWGLLAASLLVTLLAPPLGLLMPLPLAMVLDSVIGTSPAPAWLREILPLAWTATRDAMLWTSLGSVAVFTLLVYLQGLVAWVLITYVSEKLILLFRSRLFAHVQRLSVGFHDTFGVSHSVYRIQYDVGSIQWILMRGGIPIVSAFVTLFGMIGVMALIDWPLALVALGITVPLYVLTDRFGSRLRDRWVTVKDLDGAALAVIHEVLSSVRVVKAFGQEEHEEERFGQFSEDHVKGQVDVARQQGLLDLLVGIILIVGTVTVLWLGVRHVQQGTLTAGALVLVMTYLAQIYAPLQAISQRLGDLQNGFTSADRALRLLDEDQEVPEAVHPVPLRRAQGNFEFRDVEFGYDPDRVILQSVNLQIPAGACVGITGRTGSGKTTLISLLLRFHDPTAGSIFLDGEDLRNYALSDLRSNIALVLQEAVLFSTTLAENIAYGRPGASQSEIENAARLANAHDFIIQLPDGYQTQVGERGMKLSGGERQRISLARAFLKDSPILILDEPTSAVDVGTETLIMEAIARLTRNRTTFVIAHRLSTLDMCTMRVHVEDGKVRTLSPEEIAAVATGSTVPSELA